MNRPLDTVESPLGSNIIHGRDPNLSKGDSTLSKGEIQLYPKGDPSAIYCVSNLTLDKKGLTFSNEDSTLSKRRGRGATLFMRKKGVGEVPHEL